MKEAVRALIVNGKSQLYMVVHHYFDPRNHGKWSTVGGRVESGDVSEIACLRREFTEEFGEAVDHQIKILDKVAMLDWKDEFNTGNTVRHHFYHVEFFGDQLVPAQPEEIVEGRFLTMEEIQSLKAEGKLFFGCEDEYGAMILGRRRAGNTNL